MPYKAKQKMSHTWWTYSHLHTWL